MPPRRMRTPIALGLLLWLGPGCFSDPDEDGAGTTDTTGTDPGATATGTGADTGTMGSTDTGTGSPMPTCETYCDLVMSHCQDGLAQYSATPTCMAMCAAFPIGEPDAELGNNLACRTFHAVNAGEDPETHCPHAGPSGAGVCGGNCESFCLLQAELCTGADEQYANTEACTSECEQFPDDGPFNVSVPDDDTYVCRMKHLTFAALDSTTHCPHIVLDSPVCQ